jgi:hypothetical protein
MNTCLNCGAEIESEKGRRPKQFCANNGKCRNEHWRKKQPKEIKATKGDLQLKVAKLEKELELERQNRSNPFINAARGRGENGVNNDEMRVDKKEKIAALEAELALLGNGELAAIRKNFLMKQISKLKYQ